MAGFLAAWRQHERLFCIVVWLAKLCAKPEKPEDKEHALLPPHHLLPLSPHLSLLSTYLLSFSSPHAHRMLIASPLLLPRTCCGEGMGLGGARREDRGRSGLGDRQTDLCIYTLQAAACDGGGLGRQVTDSCSSSTRLFVPLPPPLPSPASCLCAAC